MPKYKLYHVEKDQYRLLTEDEIAQIQACPAFDHSTPALSAEELHALFLSLCPPSLLEK